MTLKSRSVSLLNQIVHSTDIFDFRECWITIASLYAQEEGSLVSASDLDRGEWTPVMLATTA